MPVPLDALVRQMSGAEWPRSGIDRFGGLLQNNPPPPLNFVENMPGSNTLRRPDFPLLPAGDVVPGPWKPGPFQGPTPSSADYMIGKYKNPDVLPISPDIKFWNDWFKRQIGRPIGD